MKTDKDTIILIVMFILAFGGLAFYAYLIGENTRKSSEEWTTKCEAIGGVYVPGSLFSAGNCVFPPERK